MFKVIEKLKVFLRLVFFILIVGMAVVAAFYVATIQTYQSTNATATIQADDSLTVIASTIGASSTAFAESQATIINGSQATATTSSYLQQTLIANAYDSANATAIAEAQATATIESQLYNTKIGSVEATATVGAQTNATQIAYAYATSTIQAQAFATSASATQTAAYEAGYNDAKATTEADAVSHYIGGINSLDTPNYRHESEIIQSHERTDHLRGEIQTCIKTGNMLTQNFSDLILLGANETAIWPGAIIQGNSLDSGIFATINLNRKPGTITGFPFGSVRVDEPSQATVRNAITGLLPTEPTPIEFAGAYYYSNYAHSFEQAMLAVNVSADWAFHSFGGNLEFDTSAESEYVVLFFSQSYYTMSFVPDKDGDFFKEVSPNDLEPYSGPANPPTYVSSVTYGRMLIAIASAKRTQVGLKAALDYAYSGLPLDTSLATEYAQILSNAQIQIVAFGGSNSALDIVAGAASNYREPISNDEFRQAFRDYITDGGTVSKTFPGVPISFRVNHVSNSQPVLISDTIDYQAWDCSVDNLPPASFRVALNSICPTQGGDEIFEGALEISFYLVVREGRQEYIVRDSRENPVKMDENRCYGFNDRSQVFQVIPKQGLCFRVYGEFVEKDPLIYDDDFVGELSDYICYDEGVWRDLGTKNLAVTGNGIRLDVNYTVEAQ